MKRISTLALGAGLLLAMFAAPSFVRAASKDKPRIAVLEFKNKGDNQWWWHGAALATQDVFVTELVKSGKFRVIEREQLDALMREKGVALSGDVDPSTATRVGKLLGVNYLLTGAVTEYGVTDKGAHGSGIGRLPGFSTGTRSFVAALNVRLIDTSTGEIAWADEARKEESNIKVSAGGVDKERMFDKVMKPCIQELTASLKAADL
jgi:curli biogenesis system outer membrane secretion channel CsgG